MSINATTSSVGSSSATAMNSSSSIGSTKSKSDTSFQDEMDKVSTTEKSKETDKAKETDKDTSKEKVSEKDTDKSKQKTNEKEDENLLEATVDYSDFGAQSVLDANNMLASDIQQMINNISEVYETSELNSRFANTLDYTSNISMSQSDAEFFLNLVQNNDVSTQAIALQTQNMLNAGADVKEVFQGSQISQTLLNAINDARQNNQPLRIDFDQNISVILRFGKDGAISANFIPGDKAVEQYLRNNIETLKSNFDEKNLSYSDLSYQSRGSKQQKENRRNKQQ